MGSKEVLSIGFLSGLHICSSNLDSLIFDISSNLFSYQIYVVFYKHYFRKKNLLDVFVAEVGLHHG